MADGIIGDAYSHKSSLRGIGFKKERLETSTQQVISGSKYQKPRDLGEKIVFVNRLRDDLKIQQGFIEHNKSFVKLKLGEQERAVRHMQDIAERFKESLVLFNDGTTKSPEAFINGVRSCIDAVEKEGNSRVGDSYIFAGTITNKPPFDLSLVAEGLPESSGVTNTYYLGNSITTPVAIDHHQNVDLDVLGNYSGIEKLIRGMKIAIDPTVTSNDARTVAAQNLVDEAINELATLISQVGSREASIDELIESQQDRVVYFQEKYDELVDSDTVEIANDFMADQTALSMAYEMMRHLSNMSLVDYLK